jgi:hypothetical protein
VDSAVVPPQRLHPSTCSSKKRSEENVRAEMLIALSVTLHPAENVNLASILNGRTSAFWGTWPFFAYSNFFPGMNYPIPLSP